jgi:putative glutamine amidotransferase
MTTPRLVLVTTVTPENNVFMVREQIIKSILEANMVPVVVAAGTNAKTVNYLYASCQGLVIPGGADLHPKFYGERVGPHAILGDPSRDSLEMRLVKQAVKDKKPLLAICRGMQILWASQGGKLISHLPEITNEIHGKDNPVYKDLYKKEFVHDVILEDGTKIEEIWRPQAKKGVIRIPSMHHQSVKLGNKHAFIISGRSRGGTIESIELPKNIHPFCIGVQGHPEAWVLSKNPKENLLPKLLFEAFGKSLKK